MNYRRILGIELSSAILKLASINLVVVIFLFLDKNNVKIAYIGKICYIQIHKNWYTK